MLRFSPFPVRTCLQTQQMTKGLSWLIKKETERGENVRGRRSWRRLCKWSLFSNLEQSESDVLSCEYVCMRACVLDCFHALFIVECQTEKDSGVTIYDASGETLFWALLPGFSTLGFINAPFWLRSTIVDTMDGACWSHYGLSFSFSFFFTSLLLNLAFPTSLFFFYLYLPPLPRRSDFLTISSVSLPLYLLPSQCVSASYHGNTNLFFWWLLEAKCCVF